MFQARRKSSVATGVSFGLVSADTIEEVLALLDDFGHVVEKRRDYIIEEYHDGTRVQVREVLYLI